MYLNGKKVKKSILIGLFSLSSISTGIANYLLDKNYNIEEPKKFTKKLENEKTKFLNSFQKIKIFENLSFSTNIFNKIFDFEEKNKKIFQKINEEELKISLKKLIVKNLEKLFYKEGWNINELSAEIYYKINKKDLYIEVLVLIKKSIYSKKFTHYDWLEIKIKNPKKPLYFETL